MKIGDKVKAKSNGHISNSSRFPEIGNCRIMIKDETGIILDTKDHHVKLKADLDGAIIIREIGYLTVIESNNVNNTYSIY